MEMKMEMEMEIEMETLIEILSQYPMEELTWMWRDLQLTYQLDVHNLMEMHMGMEMFQKLIEMDIEKLVEDNLARFGMI